MFCKCLFTHDCYLLFITYIALITSLLKQFNYTNCLFILTVMLYLVHSLIVNAVIYML